MESDILLRLRADAQWFAKVHKHNKVQIDAEKVPRFAEKLKTAADEIERLRARVAELEAK